MILLETSLPCSENFYRFRNNFEKILNEGPKSNDNSPNEGSNKNKSVKEESKGENND